MGLQWHEKLVFHFISYSIIIICCRLGWFFFFFFIIDWNVHGRGVWLWLYIFFLLLYVTLCTCIRYSSHSLFCYLWFACVCEKQKLNSVWMSSSKAIATCVKSRKWNKDERKPWAAAKQLKHHQQQRSMTKRNLCTKYQLPTEANTWSNAVAVTTAWFYGIQFESSYKKQFQSFFR